MAEAVDKPIGEDPALAAAAADDVTDAPKKSPSVRSKVGSALKRAFTPRKSSATSDEMADVVEREPSDDSDGKKKKKSISAKLRSLGSKVRTPRGTALSTETSTAPSAEEEKGVEEKSSDVRAVAEEIGETITEKATEAAETVATTAQNSSKEADGVQEQVEKGVAAVVEEKKAVLPDLSDVKPVAPIDVASSAVAHEVGAEQAKATEQAEKAHVTTRDVEVATLPVVEKKVERAESNKHPRKRRGPVISGICIAVSIAFIAFKLATK